MVSVDCGSGDRADEELSFFRFGTLTGKDYAIIMRNEHNVVGA